MRSIAIPECLSYLAMFLYKRKRSLGGGCLAVPVDATPVRISVGHRLPNGLFPVVDARMYAGIVRSGQGKASERIMSSHQVDILLINICNRVA